MTWFFNDEGSAQGPLDESSILDLISAGKLDSKTLVWHSGLEQWNEAGNLSPSWWQPQDVTPENRTKSATAELGSTRRSPIPLAPTEAPQKSKPVGFIKRLFGGKS